MTEKILNPFESNSSHDFETEDEFKNQAKYSGNSFISSAAFTQNQNLIFIYADGKQEVAITSQKSFKDSESFELKERIEIIREQAPFSKAVQETLRFLEELLGKRIITQIELNNLEKLISAQSYDHKLAASSTEKITSYCSVILERLRVSKLPLATKLGELDKFTQFSKTIGNIFEKN